MNDLEMWSLLVGAVMPLVVAVAQQPKWTEKTRAIVALVACLAAGGVTAWLSGDLNAKGVTSAVLTVLVAALATYKGFWKPTGFAPAVEVRTSPGTQPRHSVGT